MSRATGRVTGKGGYNVTCQMCGQVYKNTDVKKNWKGLIVCEKDWEPRHPLDFFRTIPDTVKLPFAFADPTFLSFTPTLVNVTQTPGTGTITVSGFYMQDTQNTQVNFVVEFTLTGNANVTINANATSTLPITCVTAGTCSLTDWFGKFIGQTTVPAGTTANLKQINFTNPNSQLTSSIVISGKYGY